MHTTHKLPQFQISMVNTANPNSCPFWWAIQEQTESHLMARARNHLAKGPVCQFLPSLSSVRERKEKISPDQFHFGIPKLATIPLNWGQTMDHPANKPLAWWCHPCKTTWSFILYTVANPSCSRQSFLHFQTFLTTFSSGTQKPQNHVMTALETFDKSNLEKRSNYEPQLRNLATQVRLH